MAVHPAVNRRVVGSNPTCAVFFFNAGMVELVDTTDLKSVD